METIIDNILKQLVYDPKSPMIFNTGFFLWWFLILITVYYFIKKKQTLKIAYLTFFSFYFYYKSSGYFFVLLIISTLVDYYASLWMSRTENKSKRTLLLVASLVSNLGMLAYFKYTNFFIDAVNNLTHSSFRFQDIFLPVGISFYTFQTLSYTIDIYRKQIEPVKSILDFSFFVSFFPQLVAGPIIRAKDFISQIRNPNIITNNDYGRAVFLIISGLFKKAVISDYISVNYVDRIFDNPLLYSGFENLMGVYGYALQIYFDFSGYSDMAIGIALLLGFKLMINFDAPYNSASITEFWRRWHISLSSWLKDYLYIPLGGNRKTSFATYFFSYLLVVIAILLGIINHNTTAIAIGIGLFIGITMLIIFKIKVYYYFNLMITMLLGGLWHGASTKFIIWGGLHGFYLAIEKILGNFIKIPKNKFTRLLGIILTFHLVCLSWILFRASSYQNATEVFTQIRDNFHPELAWQVITAYKEVFIMFLLGFLMHFKPKSIEKAAENLVVRMPLLGKSFILVAVIWIVIQTKSSDIQPFIYFQF